MSSESVRGCVNTRLLGRRTADVNAASGLTVLDVFHRLVDRLVLLVGKLKVLQEDAQAGNSLRWISSLFHQPPNLSLNGLPGFGPETDAPLGLDQLNESPHLATCWLHIILLRVSTTATYSYFP